MGLFDALGQIISYAGLVKESIDSTNVQKTEEFKDEVKFLEQELENKSSYELLVEFHSQYADDDGEGLIPKHNGFGGDSQYRAYENVFKNRYIYKILACCPHCKEEDHEIQLGYRWFFNLNHRDDEELDSIRYRELKEGTCSCWRCGHNFKWKISEDDNFELELH